MLKGIDIQKLVSLQNHGKPEQFRVIWGEEMSEHFWREFTTRHKFNIVSFWCSLDLKHRRSLVQYLNTHAPTWAELYEE